MSNNERWVEVTAIARVTADEEGGGIDFAEGGSPLFLNMRLAEGFYPIEDDETGAQTCIIYDAGVRYLVAETAADLALLLEPLSVNRG